MVSIIADFHGHPWAYSQMSRSIGDLIAESYLWHIRIQFDTVCRIQKLIPYANNDRPGELYERRGKAWKLIGYIKAEDKAKGVLTLVDE